MQVDPIQPTLKAPGTKRLKVNYDVSLSKCAFKFNLRRYNVAAARGEMRKNEGGGLHSSTFQLDLSGF